MIRTQNLKKSFDDLEVLKGISLHVMENDVYGFLGHNGAGKTTTIDILAGFLKPDGGSVKIDRKVLGIRDEQPITQGIIGYLPEEPRFYPWMTVEEYLKYIGSGYEGKVCVRVDEILEWVGLEKVKKRRIKGFSRGMRQRLGMATALFHNPSIVLLDEPSSALDPTGRRDMLNMINQLKDEGKTVFFSTHILNDVERVCNRIGILKDGELIKELQMEQIKELKQDSSYEIAFSQYPSPDEVEAVRQLPWILDAEVVDNKLRLRANSVKNGDSRIYLLASRFTTPVHSVVQESYSLENLFINAVSEEAVACGIQ